MNMPTPAYIAAPYGAPTPEERTENTRRAVALAALAAAWGRAPVCVHPLIEAGVFGDDADLTDLACFQAGDVPRDVAVRQSRSRLLVDTATCSMENARADLDAARKKRIAAFAALPWPKP